MRVAEAESELERRDVALSLARDVGEGSLVQLNLAEVQRVEELEVAVVVGQLCEGGGEVEFAVQVHEVTDPPLGLAGQQEVAAEDVLRFEEELFEACVEVCGVEFEPPVVDSFLVDGELCFDVFVLGCLG